MEVKTMSEEKKEPKKEKSVDLTSIISTAIQVPGVKVTREAFLREQFKDLSKEKIDLIIEVGPVEAGCTREELKKKASRIIKERTAFSTSASFVAGIPGGWAMAATIPADIIQFYGVPSHHISVSPYKYTNSCAMRNATP